MAKGRKKQGKQRPIEDSKWQAEAVEFLQKEQLIAAAKRMMSDGKDIANSGSAQAKEELDNLVHKVNQNPFLRTGLGAVVGIGKGLGKLAKSGAYKVADEIKKQSEGGDELASGIIDAYGKVSQAARIAADAYNSIVDINKPRFDFSKPYLTMYTASEKELPITNATGYQRVIGGLHVEVKRSSYTGGVLDFIRDSRTRSNLEVIAEDKSQGTTKSCRAVFDAYVAEESKSYLDTLIALEANARKLLAETIKPTQTTHYAAVLKTNVPVNGRILNYTANFELKETSVFIHQAPAVKPGVSLYLRSEWAPEEKQTPMQESAKGKRTQKRN